MNYELLGIFISVIIQALYFAHKMGVIEKSIQALEIKQDKHNSIIERTYFNEKEISVLKEQLKVENHRIEDIEDIQNEYIKKWN